jgi:Mor family transcriptional regulator
MKKKELKKLEELNKTEYEYICEEALLNDLEQKILLDKIKGLSIVEMSIKYFISTAKVSRIIKKIKNKITRIGF